MSEKRYYWLKLQKDFFKRPDIRVIEEMENGKDYLLFYLKLLVESIDREGCLRFSDTIPYNERMLAVVTNTNIDIVRAALIVFKDLHLIEVMEDKTLYMNEVQKMVGCETDWAQKKRDYRARLEDIERTKKDNVRQEIEKEIEKELETEKEKDKSITEPARRIIAHLNEVAGTAYKSNSKATLRHISARLKEGYLEEEFFTVIDRKWKEWAGTEYERYMRPETLFGTKMESYLNAPDAPKQKPKKGGQPSNNVDWDSLV